MKGSPAVIETLNALLADELAARDQYFVHSRMLSEWGLHHVSERIAHEMDDETGHASTLIRRIIFLEGTPGMTPTPMKVGADVTAILRSDYEMELHVVRNLRKAIALSERENDFVTRDLLSTMLEDTEHDHAHWLEQQLRLIDLVGLPNYIQSQMSPAA